MIILKTCVSLQDAAKSTIAPFEASCRRLPPMLKKNRQHNKTMTKNGLNIQTIFSKRTDKQTDRFLLLGQVTE
jgi:hypothetical protein